MPGRLFQRWFNLKLISLQLYGQWPSILFVLSRLLLLLVLRDDLDYLHNIALIVDHLRTIDIGAAYFELGSITENDSTDVRLTADFRPCHPFTKRRKHRNTETQKHRNTETQKHRNIETRNIRITETRITLSWIERCSADHWLGRPCHPFGETEKTQNIGKLKNFFLTYNNLTNEGLCWLNASP